MFTRLAPITAVLIAAPTLIAALPDPTPLESPISADDYTVSGFSDHSSNPYARTPNPWGMGMRAPVTGDDLERLADLLGFSDEQREIARAMADELTDDKALIDVEFMEAAADARALHRLNDGWQRAQEQERLAREHQRQRTQQLADSFYTELQLLLTPEQQDNWELVELDRKRDTLLAPGATLLVESIDPAALVESLDLPTDIRERTGPVLAEYLRNLEPLLDQRKRLTDDLAQQAIDNQQAQQSLWQDPELRQNPDLLMARQEELQTNAQELAKIAADAHAACIRIAKLNRRTIDQLRETLSPDHAPLLDEAIDTILESHGSGFADTRNDPNRNRFAGMNRSRLAMVFNNLLPDDPDEADNDFRTMPEEMKEAMTPEQLEIATRIETLIGELYDSGFSMGMAGNANATLTDEQRDQLRDIRERFNREHERIQEQIKRKTIEFAGTDDNDDKPTHILITTMRGSVTLQRVFDTPEQQMAAMGHTGHLDDEELKELHERSMDIEQRFLDEVRATLTIQQRQAIANF